MKRKDYQKPEMRIVLLPHRSCLLLASGELENYKKNEEQDW